MFHTLSFDASFLSLAKLVHDIPVASAAAAVDPALVNVIAAISIPYFLAVALFSALLVSLLLRASPVLLSSFLL
jgi:Na+/glutamate symporter